MVVLTLLSFLAFFMYLQLGLFVLFTNVRSKINIAFFCLCACLVIWSFGTIFIYLSPSVQSISFWDKFSSFGWIFFPAFMVTFFVELKRGSKLQVNSLFRVIFFSAAALFFIQSLQGNLLTAGYYHAEGRWIFQPNTGSYWYWLFFAYLCLTFIYSIYVLIKWSLTAKTIREKKQSHIVLITLIAFFLGIFLCDYGIPVLNELNTQGIIHIISFIWITGFGYAIVKYKFMSLTPELAAKTIVSRMNELLFFVDNEGKIVNVNSFTEKILGFSSEEILNKPFDQLLADKKEYEKKSTLLNEDEKKKFMNEEFYIRQKSDEVIPYVQTRAEIRDNSGDVIGSVIVGSDIRYQKLLESEIELRKQTETALKESESEAKRLYTMMRLMCDTVPDMIWAKDLKGRYLFVNQATSKILLNAGNTEEPLGRTEISFYTREKETHPDNKNWFTFGDISSDSDELTIRNKQPGRFVEFGNIRNKFIYLDVHKAPFFDEQGNIIGIVGCGRDITTEKRVEEQHRASQKELETEKEFLSVTLKSIDEGVISTDKTGRILLINKVAKKTLGVEKDNLLGKDAAKLIHLINPLTKEKIPLPIEDTIREGVTISVHPADNRSQMPALINNNGEQRTVSISVAPIKDREGDIIGTVIVFSDITDKKRMENELNKIQKVESMSLLAGGIAHDFNNILTAMVSNLSLAMLGLKDKPDISKRLRDAEKACFRARDLTSQLLSMTKGSHIVKRVIKLDSVIKDTVRFAVRGSNCDCKFNIANDLKNSEVDESQITQVINNLVINAIQSSPEGGHIIVTADNTTLGESTTIPLDPGNYIKISVKDNGTGIPETDLQKIFDPFYTTKEQGSGLGLTSSFGIIKNHNGHITVESQVGIGSVFTIYLPASESVPEENDYDEDVFVFQDTGNVLIMDDDRDILSTLATLLQKIGYNVTPAENAEKTISAFETAMSEDVKFSFVILDLTIKGGPGGIEVLKKLRELQPDIKVIASSGYSSKSGIGEYAKHGFNAAMDKPYTYSKLVQTVKKIKNSK